MGVVPFVPVLVLQGLAGVSVFWFTWACWATPK